MRPSSPWVCHKSKSLLRDHPQMTSSSRGKGVTQSVTNSTDMLRECVTKGGGGPKMWKICVTSFMDGPFSLPLSHLRLGHSRGWLRTIPCRRRQRRGVIMLPEVVEQISRPTFEATSNLPKVDSSWSVKYKLEISHVNLDC